MEKKISLVEGFKKYVGIVQKLADEYYRVNGFSERLIGSKSVHFTSGKRYAKVFVGNNIHTFVDLTNGDILKVATYKAPAKNGVRGNIFSEDGGASVINHFGANYLR